jgi:DNA-directed RNA polymerase subunit K
MMKYTKYEKARIIGARALQLSMGAPFAIELSDDELKKINYDVLEIAKLEFSKGVIPIAVKRPIPSFVADADKDKHKAALSIDDISSEVEKIATVEEPVVQEETEEQ